MCRFVSFLIPLTQRGFANRSLGLPTSDLQGWPANVEKIKPEIEVLIIISNTPNWPFVPSRNRLPKVIAGARAAMNRYKIEDTDFWKFSGIKASVQSLQNSGALLRMSSRNPPANFPVKSNGP